MSNNLSEFVANEVIKHIDNRKRINIDRPFYIVLDNYPDVQFEWTSEAFKYDIIEDAFYIKQFTSEYDSWKTDFTELKFNNIDSLLEWFWLRFEIKYQSFLTENENDELPFGFNTSIYRVPEKLDKLVYPHIENFNRHKYERIAEYDFMRSFEKEVIVKCMRSALHEIKQILKNIHTQKV